MIDIARTVEGEVGGLKRWCAGVDTKLETLDFMLTELKALRTDLTRFDERLKLVEAKVTT